MGTNTGAERLAAPYIRTAAVVEPESLIAPWTLLFSL